ncbi:MAG: type II 3-dehydroquinate dehydratase [Slackia sp.]|nr:type II 3-dehydroquinate dehydratase [Slackia sp.]
MKTDVCGDCGGACGGLHARSDLNLLVINGPNINMLGLREPDIYGREDYGALLDLVNESAQERGFRATCYQSNHEGDLVDAIQQAYGVYDGIVINPAAYTHTSVAILDALKAVGIPFVEVHISAVEKREDFRQTSYIRAAAQTTITGRGIRGYRDALFFLCDLLAERRGERL